MLHRLALAVMSGVAFTFSAGAQGVDTSATKAWLLATDRALAQAVLEKGIAALVDALSPDAAVLFPGQPILHGRDAEGPLAARYGGASRTGWRVIAAVASIDPGFGCTTGFSTFTSAADTLHRERGGDYLACWRRSANGVPQLIGWQRSDAPLGATLPLAAFDGGAMPRSATQKGGDGALAATQDADAMFAEAGSTRSGPGEAFASWVAADGLFPGSTDGLRGVAMVHASFNQWPNGTVLLWGPTRSAGYAAGGLAFTVGEAVRKNADTGAVLAKTKYFTVWRLDADGRWRWIFDLGSARP